MLGVIPVACLGTGSLDYCRSSRPCFVAFCHFWPEGCIHLCWLMVVLFYEAEGQHNGMLQWVCVSFNHPTFCTH